MLIKTGKTGKTISIGELNKNCLGSFQVLWNNNCNTENEKKYMKRLIKNLYQKKQTK